MNLSDANTSAANQTTNESTSAVGSCPFEQGEIQLIPMRYAICEENEQLPDNFNGSLYQDSKVTQGIRPLNEGYLYLIHDSKQDTLYEYSVSENNSLIGRQFVKGAEDFTNNYFTKIFVPSRGKLLAMFMPIPLSVERADILLTAYSDQPKIMNNVALNTANLSSGGKGLIPINKLSSAIDFSAERKDSETQGDFGQYLWIDEGGLKTNLQSSIQSSVIDDKNAAILLVNDICADIAEVSSETNFILSHFAKYYALETEGHSNQTRYEIGEALLGFISLDDYLEDKLKEIITTLAIDVKDDNAKKEFSKYIKNFYAKFDNESNWEMFKDDYVSNNKSAEEYAVLIAKRYYKQVNEDNVTLVYDTLISNVREYKTLVNGGLAGKSGIKDVINFSKMQSFVSDWRVFNEKVKNNKNRYIDYVNSLAPCWHLEACYIDPESDKNFALKLSCEDALVLCMKSLNFDQTREYYFDHDNKPLSIYDNLSTDISIVRKDFDSIYKKYKSLGSSQKKIDGLKAKVETGNKIKENGKNITNSTAMMERLKKSLSLKNDLFFQTLYDSLDGDTNGFEVKASNSIKKWTEALGRFIEINVFYHDLKWQEPDVKIIQEIDALANKSLQLNKNLKNVEYNLKKLKKDNTSQAKRKTKRYRLKAAERAPQVHSERVRKRAIIANLAEVKTLQTQYLKEGTISLILPASGSFDLSAEIEKAKQSVEQKTTLTLKQLVSEGGYFSPKQAVANTANLFLAGFSTWSAFQAWGKVIDLDDEKGELVNALSLSFTAIASDLNLLTTLYEASINASLALAMDADSYLPKLTALQKWTGGTLVIGNIFATMAAGVKLGDKALKLYNDRSSSSDHLIAAETANFISYLLGFGSLLQETGLQVRFAIQTLRQFRATGQFAAGAFAEEVLSISGRFAKRNLALLVLMLGTDKLVSYYSLPPIADWAENSVWGVNDKKWSLEQHYDELAPKQLMPVPSFSLEQWTSEKNAGLYINVMLPRLNFAYDIAEYSKFKCAIVGQKSVGPFLNLKGDLIPYLGIENIDASVTKMGTEVKFMLPCNWLKDMEVNKLICRFEALLPNSKGDEEWKVVYYILDIKNFNKNNNSPEILETTESKLEYYFDYYTDFTGSMSLQFASYIKDSLHDFSDIFFG